MDSARYAVVQLDINLRENVRFVDALITNISQGGGLYDISNDEFLDGFVFGNASGTVCAPQEFDVSTSVLVTPSVTPLLGHDAS